MPALTVQNLKKTYATGVRALNGIDLTVEEGDFFALLGPNGAGKSTFIHIITGLVNKTEGHIKIFGHDFDQETSRAKACLGLVPQEFNFNVFDTVYQNVFNQAGYYGIPLKQAKQRGEIYLKKLSLWEKRNVQTRFLSGGMKRRLMIVRALLHQPPLLFLDEPTAGVDIEIRRATWEFLKELNQQGTTVILTTHYLEEAESLCKNLAIINHGELVEHRKTKDLLAQLHEEAFIFNTKLPLTTELNLAPFASKIIDDTTFEVRINKMQTLNELFHLLSEKNIAVFSMRNKSNRLEEFFINKITGQ